MKSLLVGVLALLSFNINAQKMKSPTEVVTSLFIATDQNNWEEVIASFSEEVLLDYSSMTGNPAVKISPSAIVESWKGILPGFESTHHQIGNIIHTIDGNKAKVFCYGTATHYLTDENGNVWTVVGSYDFELKSDKSEGWKISVMKFNFKYQDGNTALPQKAIEKLKS